jgi:pyrimidine-specific ribonucleoside hydrolase
VDLRGTTARPSQADRDAHNSTLGTRLSASVAADLIIPTPAAGGPKAAGTGLRGGFGLTGSSLDPIDLDVVIDCDTGMDDALALLLAFGVPGVRVLAVTCVNGNTDVDQVVTNTLKVLDVVDAPDVPVARGCPSPLATRTHDATWVHGTDGLGGVDLPPPKRWAADLHAVEVLRRVLHDAERPVTVIALGPLTNLAVLVTCYPELAVTIERVVLMGGSAAAGGNDDAAAEFNVMHDPEAADIVLRSGLDVRMYGLDVFSSVAVDRAYLDRLTAVRSAPADLAARLMNSMISSWNIPAAHLGDAGAVAAAFWPDLCRMSRHPTVVELTGRYTRGATVVDRRPPSTWAPFNDTTWPEVTVVWHVDAEAVAANFLEAVRRGA